MAESQAVLRRLQERHQTRNQPRSEGVSEEENASAPNVEPSPGEWGDRTWAHELEGAPTPFSHACIGPERAAEIRAREEGKLRRIAEAEAKIARAELRRAERRAKRETARRELHSVRTAMKEASRQAQQREAEFRAALRDAARRAKERDAHLEAARRAERAAEKNSKAARAELRAAEHRAEREIAQQELEARKAARRETVRQARENEAMLKAALREAARKAKEIDARLRASLKTLKPHLGTKRNMQRGKVKATSPRRDRRMAGKVWKSDAKAIIDEVKDSQADVTEATNDATAAIINGMVGIECEPLAFCGPQQREELKGRLVLKWRPDRAPSEAHEAAATAVLRGMLSHPWWDRRPEDPVRTGELCYDAVIRGMVDIECEPLGRCSPGDRREVKRRLMLRWHPDKAPSEAHRSAATAILQGMLSHPTWDPDYDAGGS